jgi:hypothetical protein
MNVPRFTAEASLYRTSRQYRTGRHAINVPTQMISTISPAMIREGGIDCGNCVGGECAELRCFENWTHGGGGGGGPYQGPSGGVGAGGLRGPGQTCWSNVSCGFGCHTDLRLCNDLCGYENPIGGRAYYRCTAKCDRAANSCSAACPKICT